jgi:DNA-binding beta-propeller fold protein YncE
MKNNRISWLRIGTATAILGAGVLGAGAQAHASAATLTLADPHIIAHLSAQALQQPENIALEPDGSADVVFAFSGQVARISRPGRVTVLAQIPVPANGDVPGIGTKIGLAGIVRTANGTLYVGASTGLAGSTGVYRILPGSSHATMFARLPAGAFVNGMALDPRGNQLLVTDSLLSTIWAVPLGNGPVTAWLTAGALAPHGSFGANGLKIHNDAVWVTNTNDGTFLRIPVTRDGAPGPVKVVATGLTSADDLVFPGSGDTALIALERLNEVIAVAPDGSKTTLLTAKNGVIDPTSLAIRGNTVYVDNAAYFGGQPNLMIARLDR